MLIICSTTQDMLLHSKFNAKSLKFYSQNHSLCSLTYWICPKGFHCVLRATTLSYLSSSIIQFPSCAKWWRQRTNNYSFKNQIIMQENETLFTFLCKFSGWGFAQWILLSLFWIKGSQDIFKLFKRKSWLCFQKVVVI